MSRRIAQVWIFGFLMLWAPAVLAQIPYSQSLIPTRTALGRVGLERHWSGVVPLEGPERVIQLSLSDGLLFAQTNSARLHVYDAESGRLLWTAELGTAAVIAQPVSANSYAIFATNSGTLHAIERNSGRHLWRTDLDFIPSSPTVCDNERVMVGLTNGDIVAYAIKKKDDEGKDRLLTAPVKVWNWRTVGAMTTRPLAAERIVVFGGADGKVYVAFSNERQMIYRIATSGPIGEGFGTYGTRTLLVPSADDNLYAVDLFTADVKWTFPSGSPIVQAPFVAGEDLFVINSAGKLTSLDPKSGAPNWTTATHSARLLSLAKSKFYLASENQDLVVVDRSNGTTLADPAATYQRAGINLRELDLSFTNTVNDRMYFGTSSGLILCIREIGQINPLIHRDPKALPFGYVPPEGVKIGPEGKAVAPTPPAGETSEPATETDASNKP